MFKKIKIKTPGDIIIFTPASQKSWWHDQQFLRYRMRQTEIGNYVSFFALLALLPKTIIIWGMVPEIQSETANFCHFRSFFCPFTPHPTPLTTYIIRILKKWKKYLEMSSFYTCVPEITIIWCMLLEIWSATDFFFLVIFGHFLPFYPTNNPKN